MPDKIAVIILARGKYSKRIPQKPLAILKGKTLIEHTLDFAIQFPYPVWIYTDLDEIKNICNTYVNVNVRDKKYETPDGIHRTSKEILEYNKEIQADIFILLQVTSPFRDIENAKIWIDDFLGSECDCGFAGYKIPGYFYINDIFPINYVKDKRTYNEGNYCCLTKETGSFYIFRKEQLQKNHFMNGNLLFFEDLYNIDINTIEDLKKAEYAD